MRLIALVLWLAVCLMCHGLTRLVRVRSRWPRRFLGGMCSICGIRVSQTGTRVRGGAVILANHVSWIDIPALAGATGTAFVAHDGLAGIAPLRWLCELNDTVFVARHDPRSVHRQVDQVREALRDTGALALFPEGTTGDGTDLLPFKSSLLAAVAPPPAGVSIQPVLLDYGADAAAIAWVGDEPGPANFKRILARAEPIELTIHYLPPLAPDLAEDRKRIALAARAELTAAMAERH